MAIVAVNGGGNTPNGNAADGTSNTLMVGEKLVRSQLVPMAGDGNGDGYAGSHLLYQDLVVPTTLGEVDDGVLVLPSAPAGESNEYVLTSVEHAATETSGAGTHLPPAQPGQPQTFGEPVTFTFTVSNPGYAGGCSSLPGMWMEPKTISSGSRSPRSIMTAAPWRALPTGPATR